MNLIYWEIYVFILYIVIKTWNANNWKLAIFLVIELMLVIGLQVVMDFKVGDVNVNLSRLELSLQTVTIVNIVNDIDLPALKNKLKIKGGKDEKI